MLSAEWKDSVTLVKEAYQAWSRGKTARLGASLAYYTIFAVAPLFIITLTVAGLCFGQSAARQELFGQINALVGTKGGEAIKNMILAADKPQASLWATIGAGSTLLLGAMAVFVELQDALNTIWGVEVPPAGGIRGFIKNRLLSFAMVLGIGFLMLVSLVLDAFMAGFGKFASSHAMPLEHTLWSAVNFIVALAVITLLFAMIYKILPDAKVGWRDVWIGAVVTALLFNLGKFLIGYYLGRSTMVSIYGAAGSFIVVLLWVYYSAQILFFGAAFTRVYACHHSSCPGAKPEWHSVHKDAPMPAK